jgi:8-oxo-dGTP pyrophosphatase MutT (NUDIX family)
MSPDAPEGWREAPMVRAWEHRLGAQGWKLDSLEPLDILNRRHGEGMLFALLNAEGRDPEGKPLLPYVLLRGAACVVVPVVKNRETGEKKFLMILQRRVGSGDLSLEFPAGMVDGDQDPVGTALRELEEETGLRAEASALVPLWDKGLYSSPGLSDESVHFYGVDLELDAAAYRALEGGAAGHADEGEHITTTLKTFAEASAAITSLQPLLGFFLHRLRFGETG